MLTNPIYAGAYAFGRTGSRTMIEGERKTDRQGVPQGPRDVGRF